MPIKEKVGIMERRRALETARNVLYSKVGKTVLEENKFPDRTLGMTVKRIDEESKKHQSLIDNDKKMFKRSRLIYNLEPTIVMERPASPTLPKYRQSSPQIPHYMTDIKPPQKTVAVEMPPTIDAFTTLKRKTKNVWETQYHEEDLTRRFRSIIMKSPPLTEIERTQLDKGYALYRPPSKNEEEAKKRTEQKIRDKITLLREAQRTPSPDAVLAFITQLEREAESRSTQRTRSRITTASNKELKFNPRHLERFETLRAKQKIKFFNTIKMED